MKLLLNLVIVFILLLNLAFAKSLPCHNIERFNKDSIKSAKVIAIGNIIKKKKSLYLKVDKSWNEETNEIELVVFEDNSYMWDIPRNTQVAEGQRIYLQNQDKSFFSKYELAGCDKPLVKVINDIDEEKELIEEIEASIGKPVQTKVIPDRKWFWQK